MKDETKEIKIPNNILATLGDLTNGALNYYKAPKTIELKYKLLLDYITNLQEENERLKENAIHNDKVVDKAKWNEMIYKSRNEKAIKLLKEAGCYDEETKTFCDDIWEELPKLLNILNGGDE